MDISVNVVFSDSFHNPFSPLHVYISVAEVLGRKLPPNQVEDNVGVSHTLFNGLSVPQVKFHETDPSQVPSNFEMSFRHIFSEWYNHEASLSSKSIDNVATEKACGAEDCSRVSS